MDKIYFSFISMAKDFVFKFSVDLSTPLSPKGTEMNSWGAGESSAMSVAKYDRAEELKAFDDTKEGVKGLVDAGVVNIPKIFLRPPDEIAEKRQNCHRNGVKVPVVDMSGIERDDRRREIVEEVRIASETWGFFQVVNHGIPLIVLEEMIDGIRMFNEQDPEVRKEFYSRDRLRKVKFNCNYDLFHSRAANWRDTLSIAISSNGLDPQELPAVCRYSLYHLLVLQSYLFI